MLIFDKKSCYLTHLHSISKVNKRNGQDYSPSVVGTLEFSEPLSKALIEKKIVCFFILLAFFKRI
jgi:hypothetical protein